MATITATTATATITEMALLRQCLHEMRQLRAEIAMAGEDVAAREGRTSARDRPVSLPLTQQPAALAMAAIPGGGPMMQGRRQQAVRYR